MSEFTRIGRSQPRAEGPQKVRGASRYVADLEGRDTACARLVLSPHAHARVKRISTAAAERGHGVLAVLTAGDLQADGLLARDEVFYAGEPVAVVVARNEGTARDAADLVEVE